MVSSPRSQNLIKEAIMKSIVKTVIVACALVVPALSFAQSQGLTRAQVQGELVQLEKAGFDPSASNAHYPDNLQAAEAKLQSQQAPQQAQKAPAASSWQSSQASAQHLASAGEPTYFGS